MNTVTSTRRAPPEFDFLNGLGNWTADATTPGLLRADNFTGYDYAFDCNTIGGVSLNRGCPLGYAIAGFIPVER